MEGLEMVEHLNEQHCEYNIFYLYSLMFIINDNFTNIY